MEIDLEGNKNIKKTTKYGVLADSYTAILKEISDPVQTKNYDGHGTTEKICLTFEVYVGEHEVNIFDGNRRISKKMSTVNLPMFVSIKVIKGQGTYSNSKLYDVLTSMELLGDLGENSEQIGDNTQFFLDWFRKSAISKQVKVQVKNSENGVSRVVDVMQLLKNW